MNSGSSVPRRNVVKDVGDVRLTTAAAGAGGAPATTGAGGAPTTMGAAGAPTTTGAAGSRVAGSGGSRGGGTGGAPGATAGTIVPLYTDPNDSSWDAIVSAKRA